MRRRRRLRSPTARPDLTARCRRWSRRGPPPGSAMPPSTRSMGGDRPDRSARRPMPTRPGSPPRVVECRPARRRRSMRRGPAMRPPATLVRHCAGWGLGMRLPWTRPPPCAGQGRGMRPPRTRQARSVARMTRPARPTRGGYRRRSRLDPRCSTRPRARRASRTRAIWRRPRSGAAVSIEPRRAGCGRGTARRAAAHPRRRWAPEPRAACRRPYIPALRPTCCCPRMCRATRRRRSGSSSAASRSSAARHRPRHARPALRPVGRGSRSVSI